MTYAERKGLPLTLSIVDYVAPVGYWARKLGGWCVYEGCPVKHPAGYDNGRCLKHRSAKNPVNEVSTRQRRMWRRLQLGLFAHGQ